jgi:hypothetical protein
MIVLGHKRGGKMPNDSTGHYRPAGRLLWTFAAASLLAVGAGCAVAAAAGVGTASWVRNIIAWLLGAVLAFAISRRTAPTSLVAPIAAAAIIGLAATFINSGQDGVHRWWDLGPLHINAAALILPLTIVALAGAGSLLLVSAASVVLAAILAAQSDASQATAFAAATGAALALRRDQLGWRWITVAQLAAIAGLSWLRPDPLAPVPEVEEIVQLAWRIAPIAGILGVLGLVGTALAPLSRVREQALRPEALALAIYIAIVALAPAVGAFPVPLMGIGMSPVLGLWLGVGLLAAADRPAA